MLMGEHAVLHGSRSICCAIDRRISLVARARDERRISIESSLGRYETDIDDPVMEPPFEFVLNAFARLAGDYPGGVAVEIESEMPTTVGLGTSAAVAVAACAAARALAGREHSPRLIMEQAVATVRAIQGRSSGADCAASALGGMLGYRADPLEILQIGNTGPLALFYCGYKRRTAEVIDYVEHRRRRFPEGFNRLFELVHEVVSEALPAIEVEDWKRVGFLMDFNHGLMESMGVVNADLAAIVHRLRECEGVLGAKISGSGLGDCVVALGSPPADMDFGGERIDIAVGGEGVTIE